MKKLTAGLVKKSLSKTLANNTYIYRDPRKGAVRVKVVGGRGVIKGQYLVSKLKRDLKDDKVTVKLYTPKYGVFQGSSAVIVTQKLLK